MNEARKVSLLIVDDEDSIRRSMAEFLEDFDFFVEEASSGEDAIKKCEHSPYDVAIIDLRLPGMTGDELIRQMAGKYPKMKFMIHTGSCEFQVSQDLQDLGVGQKQIIHKPVTDLSLLVDRIMELVTVEA